MTYKRRALMFVNVCKPLFLKYKIPISPHHYVDDELDTADGQCCTTLFTIQHISIWDL